jgi:hypothetical protein
VCVQRYKLTESTVPRPLSASSSASWAFAVALRHVIIGGNFRFPPPRGEAKISSRSDKLAPTEEETLRRSRAALDSAMQKSLEGVSAEEEIRVNTAYVRQLQKALPRGAIATFRPVVRKKAKHDDAVEDAHPPRSEAELDRLSYPSLKLGILALAREKGVRVDIPMSAKHPQWVEEGRRLFKL